MPHLRVPPHRRPADGPVSVRPRHDRPEPAETGHGPAAARAGSARARVLRLLASVNGRPVTGGEILAYALTTWPAAEVRALMDGMAADGLVTITEAQHFAAVGRRSRSYRLTGPGSAAAGATPVGTGGRGSARGEGGAA